MAGWLRPTSSEAGLSEVIETPQIVVQLVRLASGERWTTTTGRTHEVVAVFASGRCSATADGRFWANCGAALATTPWTGLGPAARERGGKPRRRISPEFRPLAHTSPWPPHQALWLPPDCKLELVALEAAEVLLFATDLGPATGTAAGRDPDLYGPNADRAAEVGGGAFRRLVTPLVTAGAESVAITVGETYTPPGGWSPYPPHRHDRQDRPRDPGEAGETQHHQVCVFRFAPGRGFGLARVYDDRAPAEGTGAAGRGDQALVIRHGDALAVAKGYHTLAAAPGYHLHYLWCLAGPRPAAPSPRPDPAHAWVEDEA